MLKMNKSFVITLIIIVLSSIFFTLQAQTFRIEAGYSQPRLYSNKMSHRYFNGIRMGGTVDFEIPQANFLTVQTGLSYSYAFSKNDVQKYYFSSNSDSIRINTQGHSIDIPLHITASHKVFKVVRVFAFTGPSLNIGLHMSQKIETRITDGDGLQRLEDLGYKLGNSDLYDGRLRRFNLQLDAGAGAQWWKIQVKGGYSFGMNDLNKGNLHKQWQSGWFVSTAYEF